MEIEEQELLAMISALQRKTQIFLNHGLANTGITGSQTPFLMIACRKGKVAQNYFCEVLDISRGTVAKMLAKMEQTGFLERRGNPDDARGMDVYPTRKALELYPILKRNGEHCKEQITAGMSEVERMAFGALLQKAYKNISACTHLSLEESL